MPKLEIHRKNSIERIGKERYEKFNIEELHRWIDEFQKEEGMSHRTKRHDNTEIPNVKKRWGVVGVREFLWHISEDYADTAKKWGKDCIVCGEPTYKRLNLCNECRKKKKEDKELTKKPFKKKRWPFWRKKK